MVTHPWAAPERPAKPRTHVTRTGQHVCQSTYIPRAACLTDKHKALNQRIRKKKEGTLNYLCSYLFLLSSSSPGRQDSGEVFYVTTMLHKCRSIRLPRHTSKSERGLSETGDFLQCNLVKYLDFAPVNHYYFLVDESRERADGI